MFACLQTEINFNQDYSTQTAWNMNKLDSKIPEGPLETKWTKFKSTVRLVNPANKRRIEVLVVGSGLAWRIRCRCTFRAGLYREMFLFPGQSTQSAPIAAQGGINAAKKLRERRRQCVQTFLRYRKRWWLPCAWSECISSGGNFYSHHWSVCRARCSVCPWIWRTARQPFLRWCVQVSRTSTLADKQDNNFARRLQCFVETNRQRRSEDVQPSWNGGSGDDRRKARGIIAWPGDRRIGRHFGHAVVLATGGYGNVFYSAPTRWEVIPPLSGRHIKGELISAILVSPNPPDLYSCFRRLPKQAYSDERKFA